jgi:peptide chain release factor 1
MAPGLLHAASMEQKDNMLDRLAGIERRYDELERFMADPRVASDYERVAQYAQERAELEEIVNTFRSYKMSEEELAGARAILDEEEDGELRQMAFDEVNRLRLRLEEQEAQLRLLLLPKDPRDERDVIVEIRAGTGGDEAGLFAADLYRMYSRYAEQRGWKTEMLSSHTTGIGGFKEVIVEIAGKGAYSRLKYESGVHRVQRVPVTESQGRIHTSTATVAVLPEADEVEVHIDPTDLDITAYGSSGPGGQHMQKNATAIRVLHVPTGMVVTCESERSQTQNKTRALSVLRARIYEMERQKHDEAIDAARRAQVGTGERSEKIRTYNFPQSRVTDHRIGLTVYRLATVLQGDLDEFIDAMAAQEQTARLQAIESA